MPKFYEKDYTRLAEIKNRIEYIRYKKYLRSQTVSEPEKRVTIEDNLSVSRKLELNKIALLNRES